MIGRNGDKTTALKKQHYQRLMACFFLFLFFIIINEAEKSVDSWKYGRAHELNMDKTRNGGM